MVLLGQVSVEQHLLLAEQSSLNRALTNREFAAVAAVVATVVLCVFDVSPLLSNKHISLFTREISIEINGRIGEGQQGRK